MPEFESEGTGRRQILGTRLMKKAWKLVLQTSSCEKNIVMVRWVSLPKESQNCQLEKYLRKPILKESKTLKLTLSPSKIKEFIRLRE